MEKSWHGQDLIQHESLNYSTISFERDCVLAIVLLYQLVQINHLVQFLASEHHQTCLHLTLVECLRVQYPCWFSMQFCLDVVKLYSTLILDTILLGIVNDKCGVCFRASLLVDQFHRVQIALIEAQNPKWFLGLILGFENLEVTLRVSNSKGGAFVCGFIVKPLTS